MTSGMITPSVTLQVRSTHPHWGRWVQVHLVIGSLLLAVGSGTGCRTREPGVVTAVATSHQSPTLWQPLEITQSVQLEHFQIPKGKYFVFPIIEIQDGTPTVVEMLLSTQPGIAPNSVDRSTGKTSDGVLGIFIPILGRATLRTQFANHQARFSFNPQIGTIWFGLAHTDQEWCSMTLKRLSVSEPN